MDRAQVAADANDMLTYMRTVRAKYQAVERIIERLEQLKDAPHDATAYQSGLDDVRGIVRELPRLEGELLWCSIGGLRACSSG